MPIATTPNHPAPQPASPTPQALPAPTALLTTVAERAVPHVTAARLRMAGMSDILARLYAARGVTSMKEARGSYSDLLPLDSLKGVREMARYLADCHAAGKRVLIVSDYDCDGATACAVLVMAFGAIGMNFDYMVPDRMVHGYGLTPAIVDEAGALDDRPDVIITVDNGISSHAGIDRARALGIDVLVTDHHLAPDVLPEATLIVNPNQPGCAFQSKNIAGCGVAWYVARALVEELAARGQDPGFDPAELLSYVALGTVADVVRLDANNRIMVSLGLQYIRNGQCAPGILSLATISGKNPKQLTCSDIGFGIGPRINAAGRLAHMGAGIECLTCLDPTLADELAAHLHVTNEERKEIQQEIVEAAGMQAAQLVTDELASYSSGQRDPYGLRSFVVYDPTWHEGVIGIVAGRIKEERHRPTIVMTAAAGGDVKGSARSIPGFHIKHALDEINAKHPGVLLKFGGHAMAAGMTVAGDKFDLFKTAFEAICRRDLTPEIMTKTLMHDGQLQARDFDRDVIFAISQQVWGQGFEEPVFLNDLVVKESKVIGKDKCHLRLIGHLANDPDVQDVEILAFGRAALNGEIAPQSTVRVAFKPGINTFRGQERLQLLVELMPQEMLQAQLPTPARRPPSPAASPVALALGAPGAAPAAVAAGPMVSRRVKSSLRNVNPSAGSTLSISEVTRQVLGLPPTPRPAAPGAASSVPSPEPPQPATPPVASVPPPSPARPQGRPVLRRVLARA